MAQKKITDVTTDNCILSYETINMDDLKDLDITPILNVANDIIPLCVNRSTEFLNYDEVEKNGRNENNLSEKLNSFGKKENYKIFAMSEHNDLPIIAERNISETETVRNSTMPLKPFPNLIKEDISLLRDKETLEILSDADQNLDCKSVHAQTSYSKSSLNDTNLSEFLNDNEKFLQETPNIYIPDYYFSRFKSKLQPMHNTSEKDFGHPLVSSSCISFQHDSQQTYFTSSSSSSHLAVNFTPHDTDSSQTVSFSPENKPSFVQDNISMIKNSLKYNLCKRKILPLNFSQNIFRDSSPSEGDHVMEILDDTDVKKCINDDKDFLAKNEKSGRVATNYDKCVSFNDTKSFAEEGSDITAVGNNEKKSRILLKQSSILNSENNVSVLDPKPNVNPTDAVIHLPPCSINTLTSLVYVCSKPIQSAKEYRRPLSNANGEQVLQGTLVTCEALSNYAGNNSDIIMRNNSANYIVKSYFSEPYETHQENAIIDYGAEFQQQQQCNKSILPSAQIDANSYIYVPTENNNQQTLRPF